VPTADTAAVERALDQVRPALALDGGDVRLVKIDGARLHLEMIGSCSTCSSRPMTQKYGVEAAIQAELGGDVIVVWPTC
jgi:Fe-S cluster biogenesis protein NfuA